MVSATTAVPDVEPKLIDEPGKRLIEFMVRVAVCPPLEFTATEVSPVLKVKAPNPSLVELPLYPFNRIVPPLELIGIVLLSRTRLPAELSRTSELPPPRVMPVAAANVPLPLNVSVVLALRSVMAPV